MIYTELTKKALSISFNAHKDQIDKGGMPYVYHPFHLAEQMDDEYSTCVALLHDVAEDSDINLDDLKAEGFPSEVIEALMLLTHDDAVPYMDYIRKVKTNPIAKKVKLADLEHNSDLSRLDSVDDKAVERANKYKHAIIILNHEECPIKMIEAWEARCCHTVVPKFILYCPLCKKELEDPIETEMILENPHARFVEDYPIKIRLRDREPGTIVRRTDFNYLKGHGTFYRFDEDHFPINLLNKKSGDHVSLVLYNIHTEQLDEVVFTLRGKSNVGEYCVYLSGPIDDCADGYFEIKIRYYLDRPLESNILVFASAAPDYDCFKRLT